MVKKLLDKQLEVHEWRSEEKRGVEIDLVIYIRLPHTN